MTKDSICMDCVSQKRVVYEEEGVEQVERSCKKMAAAGDGSGPVRILECSEYERKKPSPRARV